jgi:ferredoxin
MKRKVEIENPVIYYHVDEAGTLNYLSNTKKGLFEITTPVAEMHINIQKGGNSKTGKEWLLNTLPGDHLIRVKGRDLTNVHGSCQGCCDGCEKYCYAIHGAQQHHNAVLPSTITNLILYRKDPKRFETELDQELSNWKVNGADKVFRWHASGEIEDYDYLEMMMRVATKHPEVHFYSYTKRFKMIEKYLDKYGDFPSNFIWNLSVWKDNLTESGFNQKYLDKVQRFEWKDEISVDEYNKAIHCRSVIHDGKKKGHLNHDMNCKLCGLCWRGKCKGRTILVYNH